MVIAVTPLILTFDEAPNIERTLSKLSWAADIVVVDSGSRDGTLQLLAKFPKVRVFERRFTAHADQWAFGLEQTGIRTDWVLALDADFVLSDELIGELAVLEESTGVAGYRVGFIYCMEGKPLRGGIFPPVTVLYRKSRARYVQDGHTQRVVVDGAIGNLRGRIYHDDRKPLERWFRSQIRYAQLQAEKILSTPASKLRPIERLRLGIVLAPLAVLIYCLFVRGNVFAGRLGWFYSFQRTIAELLLALFILERRWAGTRK